MLPCVSTKNVIHRTNTNVVLGGDVSHNIMAPSTSLPWFDIRALFAYCVNLLLGQCRFVVLFTVPSCCYQGIVVRCSSTLSDHVMRVIARSAKEQMRWIDARRIIAAVADPHSGWDRTIVQFPGESMGIDLAPVSLELSISKGGASTRHWPASIRCPAFHARPKSLCYGRLRQVWQTGSALSLVMHSAPATYNRAPLAAFGNTCALRHEKTASIDQGVVDAPGHGDGLSQPSESQNPSQIQVRQRDQYITA
jgi:hypothetical protein